MALLGFLVIAGLLAAARGQTEPPLVRLPVIPLSGPNAREIRLNQNPELVALAARSLSRVLVEITGAQQAIVVEEGTNAHIDCYQWLTRFPGGTTDWLRQRRDINGDLVDPVPTAVPTSNRITIGGDFNRWLNVTGTIISEGAEVPDQGDYICRTCVARGTEFEMCHNATLTIHQIGAPPVLVKGPDEIVRGGPLVTVAIGTDVCFDPTDPTSYSFQIGCTIEDVNLAMGIRNALPVPTRTWSVEDPDGPTQIYNATENDPEFNDEFFERGNRILFMPGVIPQSMTQPAIISLPTFGGLSVNLLVTENATEASMLPEAQRLVPIVQQFVFEEIVGTYTCSVGNVFGSDMASSSIFVCGENAGLPGCPVRGQVTSVNNQQIPVGCSVCIPRGTSVTLDCAATGSRIGLMYRWTDGAGNLLSTNQRLVVQRIGNYTCRASNRDNPGGVELTSMVNYAPGTVFTGSISNQFGTRRTSGCERLNPMPSGMPDLCAFVGESLSFSCVDSYGDDLVVTEGGDIVNGSVGAEMMMNLTRVFSCAHREQTVCGQEPATLTVIVRDPARINRNSTLNVGQVGAGRSTSVIRAADGSVQVLRCPISGIEDPVGGWFMVTSMDNFGGKQLMPLDSNSPGITITVYVGNVK